VEGARCAGVLREMLSWLLAGDKLRDIFLVDFPGIRAAGVYRCRRMVRVCVLSVDFVLVDCLRRGS
jgi:hypothetical protein